MTVSERDIDFFAKKLGLSPEKTFLLLQDPDCLPEILNKVAEDNIDGIVDISFPVFAELTIIKYSKDLKYPFEEKEYVSQAVGSKFYDLIETPLQNKYFFTLQHDEDTAKSVLVFLGFFYKSLEKLRRSYPSENVYYNIAKNGFENSEKEEISYHLKDWIKVLRIIHNEVWY
ncbi:MAG: hypothetical protein EBR82_64855 [Caulobacteraceae bacterium]|nr:hypothetical protein [Caulobacteraceae bacterium]